MTNTPMLHPGTEKRSSDLQIRKSDVGLRDTEIEKRIGKSVSAYVL